MGDNPPVFNARRISDVLLTFVDVETTGLSPRSGDRVCEIALIRREPGVPETAFSTLIDPERAISPGAFRVNHITPEMLTGAPRFADVIDRIAALLRDCVIVAHNAPFDLGFLEAEFAQCGRTLVTNAVIDTLSLARGQSRFASCSLTAVAKTLGLENKQAHRAMGDCRVTQQILSAMIGELFPPPASPLVSDLITLPFAARLTPGSTDDLPAELAGLVERRMPFRIVYQRADGTIGRYNLQVTNIGRMGANVYLAAHALNSGGTRHFRLDRILSWQPYRDMNAAPGSETSRESASGDRSFNIRAMTADELPLLHDLWKAANLEFRPLVRDSVENLTLQWEGNPEGFIGAFAGKRLIGSVVATDDGRRGWINRVAVHPDYRRTGLGGALIRAAETELRRRGTRIIAALIEDYNTASRALFKKLEYLEAPEVLYYSKRDSEDV